MNITLDVCCLFVIFKFTASVIFIDFIQFYVYIKLTRYFHIVFEMYFR